MIRALIILLVIAFGLAAPFALDVISDRQHRVVVTDALEVYATSEPPWRDHSNSVVARVTPADTLKVLRIRYGKDYMVVRVKLPTGQQGYIFYGDHFRIYSSDGSKV
jgi:hypothetical protein